MKKIVITVHDDGEEIGLEVAVDAGFTTPEAIGYFDMAKLQHLEAKRRSVPGAVYAEQTPSGT